ncbi:hypothetical protein SAMN06295967_11369 [Belliella buryatensis]|uniref:Uncharacterized protein n=1 Tax=Belliella buryatensis TaxID=1500549 RepID=A0A239FPR7_9BACT|nr:hypothetical protein SAMN06295967_11369 [Belliella buryatensis]
MGHEIHAPYFLDLCIVNQIPLRNIILFFDLKIIIILKFRIITIFISINQNIILKSFLILLEDFCCFVFINPHQYDE